MFGIKNRKCYLILKNSRRHVFNQIASCENFITESVWEHSCQLIKFVLFQVSDECLSSATQFHYEVKNKMFGE